MNAPAKIGPVNAGEAARTLDDLLERAHAGEEIVIAKDGRPYARLVPLPPQPGEPRRPGLWKGLVDPISDEEMFAPCFTDEELDRVYNEDIDPDRRG